MRGCAAHESLRALQQQSRALCTLQQHYVYYEYVYRRVILLRAPAQGRDRSAAPTMLHFA